MSDKKVENELMAHEFDGIEEFDNDLPPWWLNMFYVTIVIALLYYPYYHLFEMGPGQQEQYAQEVKEAEAKFKKDPAPQNAGVALGKLTDAESLKKGSEVFATNCLPCHGAKGEGGVGPNLTDKFWIHGPDFATITRIINQGVPEKGMVTWEGVLKPDEIQKVASFIVTLQGTNPENAKAPQGTEYDAGLVGQ